MSSLRGSGSFIQQSSSTLAVLLVSLMPMQPLHSESMLTETTSTAPCWPQQPSIAPTLQPSRSSFRPSSGGGECLRWRRPPSICCCVSRLGSPLNPDIIPTADGSAFGPYLILCPVHCHQAARYLSRHLSLLS